MPWQKSSLETPTGAVLNLYHCAPSTPVKAVIQINHGMAEHAARYQWFCEILAQNGYASYVHDHRGHGHTSAPYTAQGYFAPKNGWQMVLDDVTAVHEHIKTHHKNSPLVVFGHSMGSLIAFNHILRNPNAADAAALWNCGTKTGIMAFIYGIILKTERLFKGSDVPSTMAKKLTFETWNKAFAPNRTAYDWLSRDEQQVDAYINDPLCGFDATVGLWLDLLGGLYYANDPNNLAKLPASFPIHLLAGHDDPCTENGAAVSHIEKQLKQRGMTDIEYSLLDNTRHESLNEINKEETCKAFIAWLDQRFNKPNKE